MTANHDFNLDRGLQISLPWEGNAAPALKSCPKNRKQEQKLLS